MRCGAEAAEFARTQLEKCVRKVFCLPALIVALGCGARTQQAAQPDPHASAGAGAHEAAASAADRVEAQPAGSTAGAPPPVGATGGAAGAKAAAPAVAGAGPAADGGSTAAPAPALDAGSDAGSSVVDAATAPEGGSDAASDAGTLQTPDPARWGTATGPCPTFAAGYVMFHPHGVDRRVLLYLSDKAKTLDGPLIFSWHSTLPNPEDAVSWIGRSQLDEIEEQGGIVAAPTTGYPNETRPWDNTPMGAQNTDGDQQLMDEIVACAIQEVGIDVRRIHSIGMSAGGLKTAQVSLRRSGYLASVVVYSGGLTDGDHPPDQDPQNHFAAMILYGGPTDISPVDGINYTQASKNYRDLLRSQGRFAFLCNHGGGHSVPQDSQASAWRFMQDHPFGTEPEPYAKQLPNGFLSYCSLE